jgi:hypothetical protein
MRVPVTQAKPSSIRSSIHSSNEAGPSVGAVRPAARALSLSLSLSSLPLLACDHGFACCLGLCLPPLAPKSFTAVSNEAMI